MSEKFFNVKSMGFKSYFLARPCEEGEEGLIIQANPQWNISAKTRITVSKMDTYVGNSPSRDLEIEAHRQCQKFSRETGKQLFIFYYMTEEEELARNMRERGFELNLMKNPLGRAECQPQFAFVVQRNGSETAKVYTKKQMEKDPTFKSSFKKINEGTDDHDFHKRMKSCIGKLYSNKDRTDLFTEFGLASVALVPLVRNVYGNIVGYKEISEEHKILYKVA